jgi:hypothetical protein
MFFLSLQTCKLAQDFRCDFPRTRVSGAGGVIFHPPTQEATAVKLWRNAQRVSSDPSARAYGRSAEALAKEDTLPAFVAVSATTAE